MRPLAMPDDERARVRGWLRHAAPRFGGRTGRSAIIAIAALLLAIAASGLATLVAALAVYRHINDAWPDTLLDVYDDATQYEPEAYLIAVGVGCAALALATGLALVVWLRLGCLAALRRRHACPQCGHDLSGQPVLEQHAVRCSECGHAAVAIAAWGELGPISPAGGATFQPNTGLAPRLWTRRRLILAGRVVAVLIALALIVPAGRWVYIDIDARTQASQARAARLPAEEITRRINEGRVRPPGGAIRAETVGPELSEQIKSITNTFNDARGIGKAPPPKREFPIDVSEYTSGRMPRDESEEPRRALARELLLEIRAAGVVDRLYALPKMDLWHDRVFVPADSDDQAQNFLELGIWRNLARLGLADLRENIESGDSAGIDRAMRAIEAIAEHVDHHPALIGGLVAESVRRGVVSEYLAVVIGGAAETWFTRIEGSLQRLPVIPLRERFEHERLFIMDHLAAHYSDPGRVKRGHSDPAFTETGMGSYLLADAVPFGTFEQARDASNRQIDLAIQACDLQPFQRQAVWAAAETLPRYTLADSLGAFRMAIAVRDRQLLQRQALVLLIALDRFRLKHGRVMSVEEFRSAFADDPRAKDPFTGRSFGYRLRGADDPPGFPEYLLWSAGRDGVDQGGVFKPHAPLDGLTNSRDPIDVPLNIPTQW